MVLALAGDSTMTREEPPALSAPISTSVTVGFFARFVARFVALRTAMSVHRFPTFVYRRRKTSTFDQRPEVFDRNSAVDLHEGALDQLFELERSEERRVGKECRSRRSPDQ